MVLQAMRALFLGNSYTHRNGLVAQVVEHSPLDEGEEVSPGGARLLQHAESEATLARLREPWDIVVLQGQSLEPVFDPAGFLEAGSRLAALADAAGASVVLYETWARQPGHAFYRDNGVVQTAGEMQHTLSERYRELAEETGARVAPVGQAFARRLEEHAGAPLFADDGHHPSAEGSLLAGHVLTHEIAGLLVHTHE